MESSVSLSSWFNTLILFLQKFTNSRYWKVKFIGGLVISSLFFSTPAFFYVPISFQRGDWKAFDAKRDHPFTPLNYSDDSNMAKKVFRLTMPLIANVFHLNNQAMYLLQLLSTVLFLYITLLLAGQITGDAVTALLVTTGMAFIYTGRAGFTDTSTWFDEFAFLFLLLSMFSKKSYLILLFSQLAFWEDERAVIASGFVFIWWKLQETPVKDFKFNSLFKFRLNSTIIPLSVVAYCACRFLLIQFTDLRTSLGDIGFKVLLANTDFWGMGLWGSLEGFWALIIVGMLLLYKHSRLLLGLLTLFVMGAVITAACSVEDITRSAAYAFPVIFISLAILKEWFSINDIRKILLASATFCFLFPAYYIQPPHIQWYKPLVVRIVDMIKHHLYGNTIDY